MCVSSFHVLREFVFRCTPSGKSDSKSVIKAIKR